MQVCHRRLAVGPEQAGRAPAAFRSAPAIRRASAGMAAKLCGNGL